LESTQGLEGEPATARRDTGKGSKQLGFPSLFDDGEQIHRQGSGHLLECLDVIYVNAARHDYVHVLVEAETVGFALVVWLVTRLYRAGVKKLRHWDQSWRGSLQLAALVVCEEFLADRDKLNPSMKPAARIKAPV